MLFNLEKKSFFFTSMNCFPIFFQKNTRKNERGLFLCLCSSSPHLLLSLSAPCPLPTFFPTVNCATGVVSVTWNSSVAGVVYAVSAVDATGRRHNCSGTNAGCNLTMLECGTKYNVTVTPAINGCVGRDSPTKLIKTGKDQHFSFA